MLLLYHFNFGFPLLSPSAKVVGPITKSVPNNEESAKDKGVEECLGFPEPVQDYTEKVFFHTLAAQKDGSTFVALVNRDTGDGQPLGIVLRWSNRQLPSFTQWKMPCKGFYVVGLEPGNCTPIGRGALREKGALPMIEGQASYDVAIDFEVLDTMADIEAVEKEARKLAGT
jgi:hypothetical protein